MDNRNLVKIGAVAALLIALSACGSDPVPARDAAQVIMGDAGVEYDASVIEYDASVIEYDAGSPEDAQVAIDAGSPEDAQVAIDAPSAPSCDESRSWVVESTTCSRVSPASFRTTLSAQPFGCQLEMRGTASCGGTPSTSNPSFTVWTGDRSTSAVMFGWCGLPDPYACTARLDALDRLVLSCTGVEACSITLVEDTSR